MARKGGEKYMKKVINTDILSRFLSASELEELIAKYDANKKNWGGKTRFESLARPIEQTELDLLKDYFNKDLSLKDIADKHSLGKGLVIGRVKAVAIRYISQKVNL